MTLCVAILTTSNRSVSQYHQISTRNGIISLVTLVVDPSIVVISTFYFYGQVTISLLLTNLIEIKFLPTLELSKALIRVLLIVIILIKVATLLVVGVIAQRPRGRLPNSLSLTLFPILLITRCILPSEVDTYS